jgi:hypothetical protein
MVACSTFRWAVKRGSTACCCASRRCPQPTSESACHAPPPVSAAAASRHLSTSLHGTAGWTCGHCIRVDATPGASQACTDDAERMTRICHVHCSCGEHVLFSMVSGLNHKLKLSPKSSREEQVIVSTEADRLRSLSKSSKKLLEVRVTTPFSRQGVIQSPQPLDWAASESVSTAGVPSAESVSDAYNGEGPAMPKSSNDAVWRLTNVATEKVIWHSMCQGTRMPRQRNEAPERTLSLQAKP